MAVYGEETPCVLIPLTHGCCAGGRPTPPPKPVANPGPLPSAPSSPSAPLTPADYKPR